MLNSLGVKLAVFLIRRGNLSDKDANICTTVILDKLQATPFSDIIKVTEEGISIRGKLLDVEQARNLRESAKAALSNKALSLVLEQTAFAAMNHVAENAETPVQMIFARAAMWLKKQQTQSLEILAQRTELPSMED